MPGQSIQDTHGNWIFITPIENLVLTDAVKGEFSIGRATFVSATKFPRVRKRLGIRSRISEINKKLVDNFFTAHQTYAIVRHTGKPREIKLECLRYINEALAIIALSQLGFARRSFHRKFGIHGQHSFPMTVTLFLNTGNSSATKEYSRTDSPIQFELDRQWVTFQKGLFFSKLIRILTKKVQVADSWRQDLWRAAVCVGKGILSNDIPVAFLQNMIALEILLTHQGDTYSKALPERIEAFLGWAGYWKTNQFEEKISRIYKSRSAFVHDGSYESISKEDLIFSDDLLLNLFFNLCSLSNIFKSKNDVIAFSEKVKAEKLLGSTRKVRPKKLAILSTKYTQVDLSKL